MNENLRRAMLRARLSEEDVAVELQVDPKTVRRWLEGRVPYLRHRWVLANLLGAEEADLWPEIHAAIAAGSRPAGTQGRLPQSSSHATRCVALTVPLSRARDRHPRPQRPVPGQGTDRTKRAIRSSSLRRATTDLPAEPKYAGPRRKRCERRLKRRQYRPRTARHSTSSGVYARSVRRSDCIVASFTTPFTALTTTF